MRPEGNVCSVLRVLRGLICYLSQSVIGCCVSESCIKSVIWIVCFSSLIVAMKRLSVTSSLSDNI